METFTEKTVLVPVANGTEEMEAVIIIDVLRRAGSKVTVASVEDQLEVTCSRGVKLVADKSIQDCSLESYDLIALPGGMPGATRLYECSTLVKMMITQKEQDKLHGAICAAPAVFLEPLGFLKQKKATAHPAFVQQLTDASAAESPVVIDGKLVTSRGPGTAFSFALALVKELYGEEKMQSVANPMVLSHN
eukprot:g7025.t1